MSSPIKTINVFHQLVLNCVPQHRDSTLQRSFIPMSHPIHSFIKLLSLLIHLRDSSHICGPLMYALTHSVP